MKGGKYAYLVCVDGEANSNKYYEMKQTGPYEFISTYGREGKSRAPSTHTYSMHEWGRVYRNKTRKRGRKSYTDVTHLKQVEVVNPGSVGDGLSGIVDSTVRNIISKLQQFATGSVRRNYKVASRSVTQAMVDEAQGFLDQIAGLVYTPNTRVSNRDVNDLFEMLYTAIPRQMGKVANHMLPYESGLNLSMAKDLFSLEQANVDVMAQQVKTHSRSKVVTPSSTEQNILASMGLAMRLATSREAASIKAMGDASRMGAVFVVEHEDTKTRFDGHIAKRASLGSPHNKVARYWHGSRNENWLSILDTGLLIRPPKAASTGDMFGIGIYFADKFSKSFNYTGHRSAYWTRGTSSTVYMAIFEVHVGKQYEVGRHSSSCYGLSASKLQRLGNYDSTWGRSGRSLLNSEYIVYRPEQCTIAYLVEIR